ncbi:hypothetical protein KY290_035834 [Solanum tuberosum]|uniref:Uncharacterized protein n=1 Tax=Solanum tuberosum TaxID=4113 RepID=A0ABQ7TSE2_SOLTU|nr:hypothetical protein KY290_035834 [Solanum tuberosum]
MEVLPVSDLDVALHNFVNKDEKMAFYSCVQYNLEETRWRGQILLLFTVVFKPGCVYLDYSTPYLLSSTSTNMSNSAHKAI